MTRMRLAASRDAAALAAMNREFNGSSMGPAAIRRRLGEGDEIVAVAVDSGRPIGFACAQIFNSICYSKPYAELTELFVKEEHRRRGVATSLIGFMEKLLTKRKVVHIHILTGVRNRPARALYEGLGYKHGTKRGEVLYDKDVK